MLELPTPRAILEILLPHLRIAGAYAREIQSRIVALPEKGESENFFATALTDADLSVQTFVEVALLGKYPQLRFYGEEWEQSYNTKYFRGTTLGEQGDYLVTLDPIDGTRYYLDGHPYYLIILAVLNADDYEAVIALSPSEDCYFYALRGEGCFRGKLEDDLNQCQPLRISEPEKRVYLGWKMASLLESFPSTYEVVTSKAYTKEKPIPAFARMLQGAIAGAILDSGKFIDGAALAFLAKEAGALVTNREGLPLPPLSACEDYRLPGLVIAANAEIQRDLLDFLARSK
ncbi:MAG: inositol monophosphatase family protein [Cyanobacteria bacterium P01_E01_bin.42]